MRWVLAASALFLLAVVAWASFSADEESATELPRPEASTTPPPPPPPSTPAAQPEVATKPPLRLSGRVVSSDGTLAQFAELEVVDPNVDTDRPRWRLRADEAGRFDTALAATKVILQAQKLDLESEPLHTSLPAVDVTLTLTETAVVSVELAGPGAGHARGVFVQGGLGVSCSVEGTRCSRLARLGPITVVVTSGRNWARLDTVVPPGGVAAKLTLTEAPRLSGSVHDTAGRPVPGLRVILRTREGDGAAAISSIDGRFEFEEFPRGAGVGEVWISEQWRAERRLVALGDPPLDLTVVPAASATSRP